MIVDSKLFTQHRKSLKKPECVFKLDNTNNSDCFYYAHFGLSYNYKVSSYEILDTAKSLVCDADTIDFIDGVSSWNTSESN